MTIEPPAEADHSRPGKTLLADTDSPNGEAAAEPGPAATLPDAQARLQRQLDAMEADLRALVGV